MTDQTPTVPGSGEPEPEDFPDDIDLDDDYDTEEEGEEEAGPPHPVNWYLLRADVLEKSGTP